MNRSTTTLICRDFFVVLAIGFLSAGGGLLLNKMRGKPFPLHYRSVQERLNADVQKILDDQIVSTDSLESKTVSLNELKLLLAQKRPVILDARARVFYDLGHIPFALSLPRQDFLNAFKRVMPSLKNKQEQLVVYCSGGSCKDSDLVAKALMRLGYENVYQYRGGWEEWSSTK